ncbi:2333_t:CDS:1, partial [Racocetra fulgida]
TDNKEEQVINRTSDKVEIDEIERKNVKVSSINDNEMSDKKSEDSLEQNSATNDLKNYHENRVDAEKDNFVNAIVKNDDKTVFNPEKLNRSSDGISDICYNEINVKKDERDAYNSHQDELN